MTMQPANPPSAAPLDLDALERLATQARDTMAYAACRVLDGEMDHEANAIASRAQGEFLHAVSSPAVILALLAAVERGEDDTEKFEEALDDEQNAHLETQRALVLLANQLETHSVPFVPAAELATYKARRDVEEFDKLLARGMEAAHQAYDAAKAKLDAARAHPPIQETDNAE